MSARCRRDFADLVAVAHPDRELLVQSLEEGAGLAHCKERRPVLTRVSWIDLAAKVVGDQLHAVTDAEHWDPGAQRLGVDLRGAGLVDARGTAAENQPGRVAIFQLGPGGYPGSQTAAHVRLAPDACHP